jgi:5-methylcytosine-specific restriction endonuclease McrA
VTLAAQAFSIHLPWWVWALAAVSVVVGAIEEQQRAARKAKHRAYLKSREWRARRRSALERAGGRCGECGSERNLHVHHLTYKRHGNELQRDLRVLCARCHGRRHRQGGRGDDLVDRFIGWMRDSNRQRQRS